MFENPVYGDPDKTAAHGGPGIIHVVGQGDTLYRLSEKYHVSVSDLMYENPFADIYNLRAGDELFIPVCKNEPAAEN